MKKTVVLGASTNEDRYSNKCIRLLQKHGHPGVGIGMKEGQVGNMKIVNNTPHEKDVDTVAIYLAQKNQEGYYDYVISLNPKRIIFSPGSENPEFQAKAKAHGIEVLEACPLVMMGSGTY